MTWFFLTGTDEHGPEDAADGYPRRHSPSRDLADRNAAVFRSDGRGARRLEV